MNESANKIATVAFLTIILILGVAARLYKVDSPPVDHQEWRQCDTASMARNFYRNGTSILYPQIDWGGNSEGFVESEFPLFPYSVSLIYRVKGIDFKAGRFFSVMLYPLSAFLIFLIGKIMYDGTAGLASAFIFSVSPMSVYYYRTFMPESLLLFFILLSFFLLLKWQKSEKRLFLILSSFSFAFALLIKVLVLFLLLPLFLIIIDRGNKRKETLKNAAIFSLISLLPPIIWYAHAYFIYLDTGITFGIFSGGFLKFGTYSDLVNWSFYEKIFRRVFYLILTPFGLIFFLAGIFLNNGMKKNRFIYLWLILLPLIAVAVSVGFYAHDYYLISFLPPFAIITGKAIIPLKHNLMKIKLKTAFTLLIFIFALVSGSYLALTGDLYIEGGLYKKDNRLLEMARFIAGNSKKENLIAVCGTPDKTPLPALFYLSDRRGWYIRKNELTNMNDIESFIHKGAELFVTMEEEEYPILKEYKKWNGTFRNENFYLFSSNSNSP